MKKLKILTCLLLLSLGLGLRAQERATLTVFAAASLTNAYEQIGAAFSAQYPDVELVFSFAASSTLAAQINEGAPADVFASANLAQMDAARQSGRISQRPRIFASNRLVLIVPADNPAALSGVEGLAQDGLRLVLAAPGVPVRDYSDALIAGLAQAYGADFPARVYANLVSEEENVRRVAAKIALGEADAGLVYLSDVTPELSAQVQLFDVPPALSVVARYPIAALDDGPQPALARDFVRFVFSRQAQDILACWNFVPIRAARSAPICP